MNMKLGKLSVNLFGVVTALSLVIAPIATAQSTSTTFVAETASVVGACGKLFDVDSNAAGLTAQERAAAIQKNLDYAIVHAANRTPAAVRVLVENRNPVVTLDGFHIATADGNSAERAGMSQMALAQKWADSIKLCLADAAAMDKYLSMLTGNYKPLAVTPRKDIVAYLPAGDFIPVKLVTPIDSELSRAGDQVEAVVTTDIPLRTSQSATEYEAYIPAGTAVIGVLADATNNYAGKGALSPRFSSFRTPDGSVVPIVGHIFGGMGNWVAWNTHPMTVESASSPRAMTGILASKGTICGGWRGDSIGAGLDVPYQKLVLTRRTGVAIPAGEAMMLQMSAPTAIALSSGGGEQIAAGKLAPLAMEPGNVSTKTVNEQARIYVPARRVTHVVHHHAARQCAKQETILK
jgi:hypothetical protein